jgi:hypothetical protein
MDKRLVVVSLALVLLIALALPTFAQPDPPLLKVEPASYTAEVINEIFNVNVTINALSSEWQVIGAEFKLRYNTTLLEVLSVAEGPFLRAFSGEPNQGVFTTSTTKADYVIVGIVILPDEHGVYHAPFPSGSGTLATITFKAIYQPFGSELPPETCSLELLDVKLSDTTGVPPGVPSTTEDGSYTIMPIVLPILRVEPVAYTATEKNEIFDINVTMNDLDAAWGAIAVEFKLRYNTTLLEVLSVAEGPFLRAFSGEPNQGTFFGSTVKAGYVVVGIVILPDGHGVWHEPFPSGSGTLATITFEAIYQSLGLGLPPDTCALEIFDVKLSGVPYNAEPPGVPSTAKNGSYEIIPRWNIADLNNDGVVDIFDLAAVAVSFGSEEGQPTWNPIADLNNDGIVDIFDLVLIAIHFGETRP